MAHTTSRSPLRAAPPPGPARGALRRWAPRPAVAAAGVLLALSFPVPAWWWLGWVGVAPVVWLVATSPTRREALVRSWLGGIGFLLTLHYWLIPHMEIFTLPAAAFAGLFWLPVGLATWAHLGPADRGGPRPLWALAVIPATWVVVEGIRSWEYLGGSWGQLGLSQWQVGPILQTAALGGVWLLSLLLVVTNVGLAVALLPGVGRRKRWAAAGVAVVVPVAMGVYGLSRPDPPVGSSLTVAGVQPGVIDPPRQRLQAHVDLTTSLERPVDVVVWGQSSVAFDPFRNQEVDRMLRQVSAEMEAPLLVNIDAMGDDGRIRKEFVHYTEAGAQASYAKRRLVPFGEYIPLRPLFGWVADFTEAATEDRARGVATSTIPVAGVEVGPLVSYESTFPDMRRRLARLGADLTIVQGGTWTFQGTWAQPQQASYEAVRAVASGRPALLATVSGTSAAFDARGRPLLWLPADREDAYLIDIPLSQETTPYVRWGDWALWLAWATVAVAVAAGVRRRRRKRRSVPGDVTPPR